MLNFWRSRSQIQLYLASASQEYLIIFKRSGFLKLHCTAYSIRSIVYTSGLNHVEGMVSGGWDSQNDSGSGKLKSLESSLSYPVASEGLSYPLSSPLYSSPWPFLNITH